MTVVLFYSRVTDAPHAKEPARGAAAATVLTLQEAGSLMPVSSQQLVCVPADCYWQQRQQADCWATDAAVAALAVAVAGLLAATAPAAAAVPAAAVAAAVAVLLLLAPAAAAACVRLLRLLPSGTGLCRHGMRPGRAGSSPGGTACSQRRSGTARMQESVGRQAGR